MRILLVKPKPRLAPIRGLQRFFLLEPLELGYLAAFLPREHEVRVLDLRPAAWPDLAFRRALAAFRPDVVGLSGYTHEGSAVKRLAGEAKRLLPSATVVAGGHHATVDPADYDVPQIDAIVRGEGCAPFRAIVEARAARRNFAGIPNVLVPGSRFDAGVHGEWPRYPDPAGLPAPRRDLWDPRRYRSVWVAEEARNFQPLFPTVATVRSSFGCRMKCSFCVVPYLCGGQHMPRPVESVVDEIAALPQDHVYFADDENFIDPAFAIALADGLAARGVRKRYFAWTRSTTVNRHPGLFRRWRAVGLDAAFLGFEFPTDRQLRSVAKGATVADNERAHTTLRDLGIAVHAAFMLLPESDEDDFAALRAYVRAMPPAQCSFTVCTPSPGTPAYDEIRPRIWVPNPHDLHDCMHPLTPTKLPLRRFAQLYGRQVREGQARNPLRAGHRALRPQDAVRVVAATSAYVRAYENIYRDYPRELWD